MAYNPAGRPYLAPFRAAAGDDDEQDIREVEDLLPVAGRTVYSMAQRRESLACTACGQRRIRRADLDAWISAQRAPKRSSPYK